jgi:hypothetical protein
MKPRTGAYSPAPPPVRSARLSPLTTETTLVGKISKAMVTRAFDDLAANAGTHVWIVDLLHSDGFEPSAVPTATERIIRARAAGLEKLVAIAQSAAIRMAVSAVRMGTGFPIVLCDSREESRSHVK